MIIKAARAVLSALAGTTLILVAGPTPAVAQTVGDIEVIVEPTSSEVVLGEEIDIEVIVRNHSDQPTQPLIAHIDITAPASSSSVDPEDWTATLSKRVGVVEPGAGKIVNWTVQPISGGDFVLYAVVIAPGAADVAASNVLAIDVTEQRSLNPEGILPVSIGGPVVIGGLWLAQARRSRRQDRLDA